MSSDLNEQRKVLEIEAKKANEKFKESKPRARRQLYRSENKPQMRASRRWTRLQKKDTKALFDELEYCLLLGTKIEDELKSRGEDIE